MRSISQFSFWSLKAACAKDSWNFRLHCLTESEMRCCKDWLAACCKNLCFGQISKGKTFEPRPVDAKNIFSNHLAILLFVALAPTPPICSALGGILGPTSGCCLLQGPQSKTCFKTRRLVAGNFGLHGHVASEMRCCTDWLAACGSQAIS